MPQDRWQDAVNQQDVIVWNRTISEGSKVACFSYFQFCHIFFQKIRKHICVSVQRFGCRKARELNFQNSNRRIILILSVTLNLITVVIGHHIFVPSRFWKFHGLTLNADGNNERNVFKPVKIHSGIYSRFLCSTFALSRSWIMAGYLNDFLKEKISNSK